MKVDHWLVVFDAAPSPPGPSVGSLVSAYLRSGFGQVAVSVFFENDEPAAVLVSAASGAGSEWQLATLIGFSNDQDMCNRLRDDGSQMIEARLEKEESEDGTMRVSVFVPFYVEGADAIQDVQEPLLTCRIPREPSHAGERTRGGPGGVTKPVCFMLQLLGPDPVQSASTVLLRPTQAESFSVGKVDGAAQIRLASRLRFPDLPGLLGAATDATAVYFGTFDTTSTKPDETSASGPLQPVSRVPIENGSPFGPSRFRFEGMETIGFRISRHGLKREALKQLVGILNARPGQDGPAGQADYTYQAASATILVELLRYGRLRCDKPVPPLTAKDYICQHELVVRILVGRLDDDTCQAREAATFVPAIFVDDPWSKVLGRELEGYPKELALFQTGDGKVVRSDGKLAEDTSTEVRLTDIRRIVSEPRIGKGLGKPFFRLDYPAVAFDDNYTDVDLVPLLGGNWPGLGRWRQADFDDAEFRRSFARSVTAPGFDEFQTLQICPVNRDMRKRLPSALVRGRFKFTKLQAQFPTGLAKLTFSIGHGLANTISGKAWAELIKLLANDNDAERATATCLTGEWYRVKSEATLIVEDAIS